MEIISPSKASKSALRRRGGGTGDVEIFSVYLMRTHLKFLATAAAKKETRTPAGKEMYFTETSYKQIDFLDSVTYKPVKKRQFSKAAAQWRNHPRHCASVFGAFVHLGSDHERCMG